MSGQSAASRRVAVLVKRFPRLSETFILNEVLELRRQGVPVDLYAIMDPGEGRAQPEALALVPEVVYLQPGPLRAELPAAWRTVRRHPGGALRAAGWVLTRHSRAAVRNFLHALVLVDRIAQRGPAHLHAHFLHAPAAIAYLAHKVSGQPYSLTGHAKDIYTTLPENLRIRCGPARFVTTCTAANVRHLVDEVGLDPATVHMCRHGVDVQRFSAHTPQPRPGRIVSVGRLVEKKGFDTLIRACGQLATLGVDFELRLVGGGELRDELDALASSLGIAERVRFLGSRAQPELVEELAAAQVFALTPVVLANGDRDGIPNVLLEAMAAGLPVVSTAVSGIPEVVQDGRTGRLVPPGRADLAAVALRELLTDPATAARLGAAGRRFVQDTCTWPMAVEPVRRLLLAQLDAGAAHRSAV